MAGPPVAPPDLPSLSAYPMGAPPDGVEAGTGSRGAALLRLFFQVDQLIDSIASSATGFSKQLDQIKRDLADVRTAILTSGTPNRPQGMSAPSGGASSLGEF
jgi:hypothetical protein